MKKIFFILLIIFIVLILCIRAAAPIFLKGIAERKLTELFNMETHIRDVDINPLRGEMTLIGVKLSHLSDAEEGSLIKAEQIELEPDILASLLKNKFIINKLAIYGLNVKTQRKRGRMMDLLDTISKGEIESLNKLGGEERNIILKKAIVKEARFNYTEFNMPYIKNIFEGDHLSYDVINIDINYDNRDLSMSGSIGNGSMGTFEMKGNLAFSEGGITFAGDSIIRNFFMNCVWPFYYERLSAIIEDGRLTMVSHFYINDGILDVKNSVRIIDFKLSPRTPRDNILGLPQDEVINHLKDEKGRINFDFTIKGPLSDPKFSLSEEFQATIQSAIVNSITTKMRKIKEIIGILKGKAPEGQGSLFPFLKNE